MDQILYLAFAVLTVLSALLAVTRKNAVAAACWLVTMFFGLAGIFVLLEAYFVAAVQILVYAGAIMVLFLFVIMLLDLRSVELEARAGPRMRLAGILLAGIFLAGVVYAVRDAEDSPRIADRVAVVLHRPAPPAAAPTELGAQPAATASPVPEAPAPEAVALEAAAAQTEAAPEMGAAGDVQPGDRAWSGAFRVDDAAGASAERKIRVVVSPEGAAAVQLDGKALPSVAFEPKEVAPERRASVAVPGAAAGTTIDVVVRRGGLEVSPAGGPDGGPYAIGHALFEHWLFPFEIASVLLTGAIFGAVLLTKRRLA
jgi:NADH:ubiquinone oxidoreductase subunit 6 (subunit J)